MDLRSQLPMRYASCVNPILNKFPADFAARLKLLVPPGLLPSVTQGYLSTRATMFRVNTLRAEAPLVLRELTKIGLICEPVLGFPHTFILKKGSFKKLTESRSYENGWIYLQSLSSQIPPLVLQPAAGEKILDMAAAPGGKTCQIAALMHGSGEVVALEPDNIRFERLKYNVEKQGAAIVKTLNIPGERLPQEHFGSFDRVLLDAPCSSEGTFSVLDRRTYGHWSVEFVQKSAKIQKRLLAIAVKAVRTGANLVYSTCALSPEENEAVIHDALKNFPELDVETITLKHPFLKPALPSWNGDHFDPRVTKARRIYPSETMEGFFVCALRKY